MKIWAKKGADFMDRVIITRPWEYQTSLGMVGIFQMGVCAAADATDEEILEACNRLNPSGTSMGWAGVVREDLEYPQRNPVTCADDPARTHFLVSC